MAANDGNKGIQEAVGTFFDSTHLHEAVDELLASGFDEKDLGLLAGAGAVRQKLGEFYEEINESAERPDGPAIAFVADKSIGDTVHAMLGTLFMVGTTLASGAVVATAAVLGGALLPAVTGMAAVGAVGGVMSLIIRQSEAEHLEEQIDEGHLLLFVRTANPEERNKAVDILGRHGAFEPRVIEAAA